MIFTIWQKLKSKKFKLATVLDVLLMLILIFCFALWNEVNADESYQYLYTGEPRITQSWSYRIDGNCPEGYAETIRERMEVMENFFNTRYLSETNVVGSGDKRDGNWLFWCSDDFSQQITRPIPGLEHLVEDITDQVSNATLGRAHLYWRGSTILEVDIQLSTKLELDELVWTIDHEIGHGSGCAHNTGNLLALMHPKLLAQTGWHIEDLKCLNHLYGPLPFSIRDAYSNVLVPQAVDMEGLSGWAVLRSGAFSIEDFGESN